MEPVVCPPGDPYALTKEDLPVLLEQYELLAKEMLRREEEGRGFTFYHYMIDLGGGPCIYKRMAGCGSGTEYLAVTPWGDLYPCHQFVGDEAYRMGTVWEGVTNTGLRDRVCRLQRLHAGGMPRAAGPGSFAAGAARPTPTMPPASIEGVYEYGCELFKKRMECAIMIQAAHARKASQK